MTSAAPDLARRLVAEALGTALLVAGVVGSGIMAQGLTQDGALALLCNAIATGALLTVLIMIFAPVSGAHFNPAVTLAMCLRGEIAAHLVADPSGESALAWLTREVGIAELVAGDAASGRPI